MPTGVFDRVVIKSGNHEIPLAQQHTLYHQCFALLKPAGLLVNLGLVFDDGAEREEFAAFVRVKDQMVGLESAVQQHHCLTRDELYPRIRQVGFPAGRVCGRPLSDGPGVHHALVGADTGLCPPHAQAHAALQAQQAQAMQLRRNGRLHFAGETSTLTAPAEITVARRPA